MNNPLFTGVCTALVTPFLDNKVNYPMVDMLLRRQLDAGISTVVIGGTTGEAPTLTDVEKIELVSRAKHYVGSACTIIAGTGSNCTQHAVTLSCEAEKAGADALLVVSPYYNKASVEGLIAHYTAIAHSVTIPIILYNVPSRTGVDMPVQVYRALSAIPNIVGVKEASTDITKIARIQRECPNHFTVWSGNDEQITPTMSLGAKGVVSVLSNLCPVETCAMVNAALVGDFTTASALQIRLLPLIDLLFCEGKPIPIKEAMGLIGYDCGGCRLPLTELSPENHKKLSCYLAEFIK